MSKTITFAGHFAVGEKPTEVEKKTLEDALKSNSEVAILVNDVDIKRKIILYTFLGQDALLEHYKRKPKCGTVIPECDLPSDSELIGRIDWDFYDSAKKELEESGITGMSDDRMDSICNKIIDKYIDKRTAQFDVQIFKEKSLRNYARHRFSKKKKRGFNYIWPDFLTSEELNEIAIFRGSQITPVCRGYMLALYEKLWAQGFTKVVQLYGPDEELPITRAVNFFEKITEKIPKMKLEFKTKIYKEK